MTRTMRVVPLVALLVMAASCTKPDKPVDLSKAIVGTWKVFGANGTMVFRSDNTGSMTSSEDVLPFEYIFISKNQIDILPPSGVSKTHRITIYKNTLTLSGAGLDDLPLTRIE